MQDTVRMVLEKCQFESGGRTQTQDRVRGSGFVMAESYCMSDSLLLSGCFRDFACSLMSRDAGAG